MTASWQAGTFLARARSLDNIVADGIERAIKGMGDQLCDVERLGLELIGSQFMGNAAPLSKAVDGLADHANEMQALQRNMLAREQMVAKAEATLDRDLAPLPVKQ